MRKAAFRVAIVLATLAPFVAASACAPETPPQVPPTTLTAATFIATPDTMPTMTSTPLVQVEPVDPVAIAQTPDGIRKLCTDHLAKARAILDEIKSKKSAPSSALTYAATIGRFDDAIAEVTVAQSFPSLMAVSHPDKAVRDAALDCAPMVDKVMTGLYLDADLGAVLKAYAGAGDKLEGERARLLSDTLREFRRNGTDLPADKQDKLRALNEEITKLGQDFEQNIAASTEKITIDPKQLAGLPAEYVAKHKPGADGKVSISTDYPDYFPFVTYAKDRAAAKDLYVLFTNRGGDANVKVLQRLLELRHDKANLLGYPTWADYQAEPRMAKSSKTVRDFLSHVRDAVREPAKAEFAEYVKEHVALGGKATDPIPPSDRAYLEDQLRNKKYKLDSKELSEYFEVGAVTQGLLDTSAAMYGLEYRAVSPTGAWHEDVKAYDVASDGKVIGRFYLDLYPRDGKFKHAAMFAIRSGKRLADGSYQTPIAALECNFPRPSKPGEPPAVMEHNDVTIFFHEFGHVLHHLLTQSELVSYSGTNTRIDFVEAPSQMFEEWAWDRTVLDKFAKNQKTGAKIPDALFQALTRSRAFGRALYVQRQVFLSSLDYEYHSRDPRAPNADGTPFDTTKVYADLIRSEDPFAYLEGTHFQSSFGHLVGYDAGYYSYQWAQSLARDVLTRFKKEGLMNKDTARAWRTQVLAMGGGRDERESVAKFLGREPNEEAYIAYIKGRD